MNEIETIFCNLMKCDRASLYLEKNGALLPPERFNRLEKILKKRLNGEPLQYLLGDTEFMGLRLKVKPGVFIPRPETEVLVEEVLNNEFSLGRHGALVLDIGTGSGNIAIALAKFLKEAKIYTLDISETCLSLAKANARLNLVSDRITFCRSDMFECFKNGSKGFEVIVSNPPYISPDDYKDLLRDVLSEPRLALVAQDGGFAFYKRLEAGSRLYLKPGGGLFLEIGQGQSEGIAKIFSDRAVWSEVKFKKDLCGIDRVAVISKVHSS